jgi:hypothetical protein
MNRRQGEPPESIARAERIVRAAGKYIEPSDDLRPRVLEAARDVCADRRSRRSILMWTLVGAVAMLLSTFFIDQYSQWHHRAQSPTTAEIQEDAVRISMRDRTSLDWGFLEAFVKLRGEQAEKLRVK